ncbi:MAG: tetratricopeptide repeat protein [Terriglobales bacterium]
MSRRRLWSLRIATAILVPAFLLGTVETWLRIRGIGTPSGVTRPCTVHGRPAFCDNRWFTAPFFPPGIFRIPAPYAIPAAKPPGTFRIFILGESAAEGDPEPSYGFGRYLEVMLRERFLGVKFEVINAGITAIDSHVLLPMAKELAHHQPDLFILYAGSNEVVGPYGAGTVLTRQASSLPLIRASIFVRSTRTGQLLAWVGRRKEQQPEEWRGMAMFLGQQVRADSPLMGHVYENFAANLHDIVAAARSSGARVLISTVATNLKDCAPFASLHREGMGEDALRSWSALVQRAAALEGAGAYAEALKLYLEAADIDGEYAELQFRIAHCLWMLGDFPAARQRFLHARDHDTLRFRADSRTNDIIRSVAAAWGPGVELVNAAALFAEGSPHGVPGSELFYDHLHMNPRGGYLLARALFLRVASMLPPETRRPAVDGDVPSEADCERLLALTREDRSRVATKVLVRLSKPPFTNQLNHDEQVLNMKREADAPIDSYDETAAQYQWAIAQDPDDRLLHLNYGLLLLKRGDSTAAAEQFRDARPYDDASFATPDGPYSR